MKSVKFKATCKYRIGEKVLLNDDNEIHEITDIAMICYEKSGKVEFMIQIDDEEAYIKLTDEMEENYGQKN